MTSKIFLPVISCFVLFGCTSTGPLEPADFVVDDASPLRSQYEAKGPNFAISAQGVASSQAADRIFKQGGHLIDIFVAVSFTISVERPQSTGIGGGGFLLYRDSKSKKIYAVDFRERAPLQATEKMFLDDKGEVIPGKSTAGIFAVATPGLVAGLYEIHKKFGKLPWKQLLLPAIELAEEGFPVYETLAVAIAKKQKLLSQFPSSQAIFLKADGSPKEVGDLLVQKDLAKTLKLIAQKGKAGFYQGEVAALILAESKRQGGILSSADLARYSVKWRTPVTGKFKGYDIYSMPPPSSGGVHVIQILNQIENDSLAKFGFLSPEAVHLTAQASQQAFADRATFLGDPDFVKVPTHELTSKKYAAQSRARFSERARPADAVKPGSLSGNDSLETTHFSILNDEGDMVASTQTINGGMGSGIVATGTGVLLNNEMDDFSAKVGAQNLFGAVGGSPNSIAPLKTPLSSMSPTLVLKGKEAVAALGAPGGTRIITCVATTLLNLFEFGMQPYDAVSSVRTHHQWKPDELLIDTPEKAKAVSGLIPKLEALGYKVNLSEVPCLTMLTVRRLYGPKGDDIELIAVSDPRDYGSSFAR